MMNTEILDFNSYIYTLFVTLSVPLVLLVKQMQNMGQRKVSTALFGHYIYPVSLRKAKVQ